MPSRNHIGQTIRARLRKALGNEYILLLLFSVLIGLAVSHGIVGFRHLISLFQLAALLAETEKYFATVATDIQARKVLGVVYRKEFLLASRTPVEQPRL